MGTSWHIGIDEVGRGPLAGPVVLAAIAIPAKSKIKNQKSKLKLRDSKKLSPKQREEWWQFIKNQPRFFYATASVYPKVIDRINVSKAANLAATRALARVFELLGLSVGELKNLKLRVFLDGGLYLQKNKLTTNTQNLKTKTAIKGDEKYNCIKLASIVAKVKRDRIMKRNHRAYPDYGFDMHKGYGTKRHIAAIKRHGPSQIHRLTFLKKLIKIV